MRMKAWPSVALVGLLSIPLACTADPAPCPGGRCDCASDSFCRMSCEAEVACDFWCLPGARCGFECERGGCTATCIESRCDMSCPAGGCTMRCSDGADCEVYECPEACGFECDHESICENHELL